MAGFVGEQHADKEDDAKYMMYTHKDLVIKYNNDQVIPYCEVIFRAT